MPITKKTEGGIDETLLNLSKEDVETLFLIWAKNDEETMKMGREAKRRSLAEAEAAAKDKAQTATRKQGK